MKVFCICLALLAVAGVASADSVYDVGVVPRPGEAMDRLFLFRVIGDGGPGDLAVSGARGTSVISATTCSNRPTGTYCPDHSLWGAATAGSQQVTQYSALFSSASPVHISKLSSPEADTYEHLSWFDQGLHPVSAWPGAAQDAVPSLTNIPTQVPEPGSLFLLGSGLLAIGGLVRRRTFK